jgi:myo-inositol-1(or 4)-monophosphatase
MALTCGASGSLRPRMVSCLATSGASGRGGAELSQERERDRSASSWLDPRSRLRRPGRLNGHMSSDDPCSLLERAVDAVHQAGELIIRYQHDVDVDYKNAVEPVTAADLAADELIRQCLLRTFPTHRVLSEEAAEVDWDSAGFDGPLWVVDPIDGTANYARKHPYVSVAVALAIDGVVQLGVVHAPFLNETFTAIKGSGAHLNGAPIAVDRHVSLDRAVISTGFPHDKGDLEPLLDRVRKLLTGCQDIRRGASPALDIAWVAAGRLDGHTETLHPWDVAAAGLIATEAGAVRSHLSNVPEDIPTDLWGQDVLFASPSIHDGLIELLRQ